MAKHIDVTRRNIGLRLNGESAEVRLWAPKAKSVVLHINDSIKTPMIEEEHGYWSLHTTLLKSGSRYVFQLDDSKTLLPDPASLSQPNGVHEFSAAVSLDNFKWEDDNWRNHPIENYIFYELHVGTFTPGGDFNSIADQLDYLVDLGITAIEIMPIAQFPGWRNWGYDGVYPFAVQNSYGVAIELQHLVNCCHKKGLAVVLDVVYNHMGPEGNYLEHFGPYFTDKYQTPWGKAINFDDTGCDPVRHFFIENALMWFRDFHIDALRLDAVHAIKDFSPTHILAEIRKYTNELMAVTGRTHHLIIECDLNDTRFIKPIDKCGYGMDAQWTDEFHHALRVSSGNEQTGYYADFNGVSHLSKAYKSAYVYDGIYSPHRDRLFGTSTIDIPANQFVVFSQNHDQIGNRMLGERTSHLVSFEMLKLLAGATILSPYLPLIFMGEEWACEAPFQYFVSHTDPDLAEAVRKGRAAEFKDFHNNGEAPDPMAKQTFYQSKINWDMLPEHKHTIMHAYYKELINIRKSEPLICHTNREKIDTGYDTEKQTVYFLRWNDDVEILMWMNFSKNIQQIALEEQWELIHNSSAKEWMGIGTQGAYNKLNPESIIVLKRNKHV